MGRDQSVYFDTQVGEWFSEKPAALLFNDSGRTQEARFRVDRNAIVMNHGNEEIRYEFPSPSYNAYKRWRSSPQPHYWIQNDIGTHIQNGDDVWFLIDFYAGEGFTGMGGLGIFDLETKEFGVFRHPFLVHCSAGIIRSKGDTLFMATGSNFEYGLYGCSGLVIANIRAGTIARLDARNSPLDGDYFYGMDVVDDHLWMLTDRAIVGWDLRSGSWVSARLEGMMASDTTTYYRNAITLGISPNGGILEVKDSQLFPMGQIEKGQTVTYEWSYGDLVEVQLPTTTVGWMGDVSKLVELGS